MFTKLLGWLKKMNDFIQQEEIRLLNKYDVDSIDEVLIKQKEIMEIDLTKIPDDVLDMAIKIGKKENEKNNSIHNSQKS